MSNDTTDPFALGEPLSNSADVAQTHRQHIAQSVEALNSRIARLGIALGLTLSDHHTLDAVLKSPDHSPSQVASASAWFGPTERRAARELAELRGLLVLRFDIEQKLATELGHTELRGMLQRIELHMEREGFAHGADGLQLDIETP
jgi:hypothetical protein